MSFNFINLFGGIIVFIMLIPNIVFVIKHKDYQNLCTNKFMNILEQIGRYSCIVLMWLPLGINKFGFSSVQAMLLYVIGNSLLLTTYIIEWMMFNRKGTIKIEKILSIIPVLIFLLSGITLHHYLLIISAIIFGIGHIYVTKVNIELRTGNK